MTVHIDPLVALRARPLRIEAPVAVLCGWGMRAAVMRGLADALGADTVLVPPLAGEGDPAERRARLHAWLRERLPAPAVLVGWSLGASIAIDFAASHPERVAALVSIAGNPCFCARPGWAQGVARDLFAGFTAGLQRDAAAQLARFAALQAQGDARERQVLRALRGELAGADDVAALLAGLEILRGWDLRAALARVRAPTLHVLGSEDRLVPVGVQTELRHLQPAATVWVAAGAAHVPFLSRPEATCARIADFLATRDAGGSQRAKREVARSFSRAAAQYDAAARVQQLSGSALLDHAPRDLAPRIALDLGCGTGARLPALQARFPDASWIAADLAEGMLQRLRERGAPAAAVGADAEALPFPAAQFDLVYSNLALQWSDAPGAVFAELARVLRSGGVALVGTLGPDTLWELRSAWRAVDTDVHVHRFAPSRALRDAARAAGLVVEREAAQWHVEHHASVIEVARGLRRTGAHNLDPGRPRGLTGRSHWAQLAACYATLGDGTARLPATWQLLQFVLRKPRD